MNFNIGDFVLDLEYMIIEEVVDFDPDYSLIYFKEGGYRLIKVGESDPDKSHWVGVESILADSKYISLKIDKNEAIKFQNKLNPPKNDNYEYGNIVRQCLPMNYDSFTKAAKVAHVLTYDTGIYHSIITHGLLVKYYQVGVVGEEAGFVEEEFRKRGGVKFKRGNAPIYWGCI